MAEPTDELTRGRDEESVFARGENDELVRREKATRDQFARTVTVKIDGYAVTVPQAVPATDARGNPLRAPDGGLVPRNSTIYDAAMKLARDGAWADSEPSAVTKAIEPCGAVSQHLHCFCEFQPLSLMAIAHPMGQGIG